jgi:apolipoprotein D and lipocalin family protein
MPWRTSAYLLAALLTGWAGSPATGSEGGLSTVAHVDLQRYAGKWYEIARYPNRFQRECAGETTATYTLRENGTVAVVNECRSAQGKLKRAEGTAKVTDKTSNAKLKVTFFWPFYGKYWILELGPDYDYAVVGEPSRRYLWILSRTPHMDEALYERLTKRLAEAGYDPAKLLRTRQAGL